MSLNLGILGTNINLILGSPTGGNAPQGNPAVRQLEKLKAEKDPQLKILFCKGFLKAHSEQTEACVEVRSILEKTEKEVALKEFDELKKETDPKKQYHLGKGFLGAHRTLPELCEPVKEILAKARKELVSPAAEKDLEALTSEKDLEKKLGLFKSFISTHKSETEACGDAVSNCGEFLASHRDDQKPEVWKKFAESLKSWAVESSKESYGEQVKATAAGNTDEPTLANLNAKQLNEAGEVGGQKYEAILSDLEDHTGSGLSKDEVLAIRIYTGSAYRFMNPAVANQKDKFDRETEDKLAELVQQKTALQKKKYEGKGQKGEFDGDIEKLETEISELLKDKKTQGSGWMDATNLGKLVEAKNIEKDSVRNAELEKEIEEKRKSLYQEGALHAGMVMESLKKVKPRSATLYRGDRMTPDRYAALNTSGYICENITSLSQEEGPALKFAATKDGDKTSVLLVLNVKEARDIGKISIFKDQKELLVLPGTRFKKIKEEEVQEQDEKTKLMQTVKKVTMEQSS